MTAMQPESLDILEKANVPPDQARAFVRAMKVEISRATDTLATKHDIEVLRHEVAEMGHGLELKIEGLRGDLETKIAGVRGDLETKFEGLEGKFEGLRGGLETKFESLRGTVDTRIEGVRVEIHQGASSITRQMYAAVFGAVTFLIGTAYFFVTHLRN